MASLMEKVTRLAIAGLAFHSPERAGRLAFRIFCAAPPRKPASPKAQAALERAAGRMSQARLVRLMIPDGEVVAFGFAPAGASASPLPNARNSVASGEGRVLVVHGYRSRTEHMLPVIDALSAKGFMVVSLDLPGHGASTINRFHLANAVEAVDAAWREFGPFQAMVGHSFGGAAVMAAASGAIASIPSRCPERIVTIAAPTRLRLMFDWFSARMKLAPAVRAALEEEVRALTGRSLSSFDAARHLAETGAAALVIHAPEDKEVRFENAERLAAIAPRVKLFRADGYGHRRILAAAPVLAEIVRFLAPVRGGAGLQAVAQEPDPREGPAPNLRRTA